MGASQIVAIVSTLAVALSYVGLALVLAPKLDVASPRWVLRGLRVMAAGFFIFCGHTHADLALGIISGEIAPSFWSSWHFLTFMPLQAIAATAALFVAASVGSVRLFEARYTREMIDRMVTEASEEVAYTGRLRGAEHMAADARRAREMADLILAAMEKDARP